MRNTRHSLVAIAALLGAVPAQAAVSYTETKGRVFYDAVDPKEPTFLFHSLITEDGDKRTETTTYSERAGGKPAVVEENHFEKGKLVRSVYRQEQVNEKGELVFKDGKAVFTFTDAEGTTTDSEDEEPNMILGSMVASHLSKNREALMAGKTIKFRYMAIERCESIGFKFYKSGERQLRGKDVVDITMKPSSIIISALVSPIRITVTKDAPHWIVESEGRTPIRWPKRQPPKNRDDWRAIDARVEYDQPQAVKAPAAR